MDKVDIMTENEPHIEKARTLLTAPHFLRELHHLLWRPAFKHGELQDAGWFCREHAMIVGCLCKLLKVQEVILMHGQLTLIEPGSREGPATAYQVRTHTFLGAADRLGGRLHILDLSLRLPSALSEPSETAPFVWGNLRPHGEMVMARDSATMQGAISRAISQPHVTAIYWPQEREPLNAERVKTALDWANSPLTDELRLTYGHDIIAKAILHLFDFVYSETPSSTDLRQDKAWERLSQRQGDAIYRVVSRAGL